MFPVKAYYIIYCSNSGYGGKTELDQAKVDMVVDCFDDMAKPLIAVFSAKTEEEKVKKMKLTSNNYVLSRIRFS